MGWVGQQPGEGGIVDMFIDDIKDKPAKVKKTPKGMKNKIISHLNHDIREAQSGIKRDRELINSLKSMRPR